MKLNTIHHEDCLDTMAKMPDDFIDLTVTSPPYDNLRDYGKHAWDFEKFQQIAKELHRVTKAGGVVVWVAGDQTKDYNESGTSFRQALYFKEIDFKLVDTMIYLKKGVTLPSPRTTYAPAFEYMFILSKGKPKTVNKIKDRVNITAGATRKNKARRQKDGTFKQMGGMTVKQIGYRTNVWEYALGLHNGSKDLITFEHPATFPDKLANDHIISWSNPKDIVYDPFLGSGTTAKMAYQLGRKYIGSEIYQPYVKIAERRLKTAQRSLKL